MTIAVVRKRNKIIMDGTASSTINSRSTAIKTILLAAWRSKLTDEEWESRIRKVLPRGVNGDVYDLADCLLKQAFIGPVPNQLFISYLKHAVRCELVSHGAVLRSIANQPINLKSSTLLLYRTSSIVCLLEFLKLFRDKISCNGTEIECLNLCHSLANLMHWLLKCILQTIEHKISIQPQQQQQQQQPASSHNNSNLSSSSASSLTQTTNIQQVNLGTTGNVSSTASSSGFSNNTGSYLSTSQDDAIIGIIDLCIETIHYFIHRPFTKSLLFIDRVEHTKDFDDNILKTVQLIHQRIVAHPYLQFIQEKVPNFSVLQHLNLTFNSKELHPSIVAAQQLRYIQTYRIRSTQTSPGNSFERRINQASAQLSHESSTNYALFNSLYPLVAFDAILRPARLNKYLARQIVTITNFNSAPISMTYCELIRVCLIGLIDAHGKSKAKATWSFFTFLKLPRLLIELNRLFKMQPDHSEMSKTRTEEVQSNDFIKDLEQAFERLCEYSPLLDESEHKCNCDLLKCLVIELIKNDQSLMPLRNSGFRTLPPRRTVEQANRKTGGEMLLKTEPLVTTMLETLNSKQDPSELFSLLSQSCSGISFEYTLSAAAATGRFHLFVHRLIEHNELYKLPHENPSSKNSNAQALNFDITFLILIYIAQRYGPMPLEKDKVNTTFSKWFNECYNQDACYSCPKEMLKTCNPEIVTSLIEQLVNRNQDIQLKSVNWHEVCFNLPMAIDEILNAWIQGILDDEDIVLVIERLRGKMCFMAVVAAIWLRNHLRTLDESDKAKPLFILNGLTRSCQTIKQQDAINCNDLKSDGFMERSSLMGAIVNRIYFDLVPNKASTNSGSTKMNRGSKSHVSNVAGDSEESRNETAYHSHKDRFISTMTTQNIFLANVKQCLHRGWIGYDSLNSLSSLFKIIGSRCFTNLIVEEILSSHESPSDLSRAVNITFGLFHLDIEACASALIEETIPNWLMSEKKQNFLNQPRSFALANLTVMTIIEVYNNLRSPLCKQIPGYHFSSINTIDTSQERVLASNGTIKQESYLVNKPNSYECHLNASLAGSKRVKLMQDQRMSLESSGENEDYSQDKIDRLNRLNSCISDLMRLFREIMSDPVMSHRTLFPVLFLQQAVVCARNESELITAHLQPEILLDIIGLFSSEMTFELVLAISNLSSTHSRKYTARAICKLAQVKESKQKSLTNNNCGGDFHGGSSTSSLIANNATGEPQGDSSHSKTASVSMIGGGRTGSGSGGNGSGNSSVPMIIS